MHSSLVLKAMPIAPMTEGRMVLAPPLLGHFVANRAALAIPALAAFPLLRTLRAAPRPSLTTGVA